MPAKAQRPKTRAAIRNRRPPAKFQKQDVPATAAPSTPPSTVPEQSHSPSRAKLYAAICFLLAVATLSVYSRAIWNPFVNYDDQGYVIENPSVQQGLTRGMFGWALTATDANNWHPLTWMSHAMDCQLFGLNPKGHHFTSILLHALSTLILFLLLVRATRATGRSLLVAALFALHPINVESVAWVAERKNVLSTLFFLLTVGAYGWYAVRPRIWRYALVVALFALALAAKPMVVTLPFVLVLVDWWPLQRILSWQPPSKSFPVPQFSFSRLVVEKIPLLLLSVGSSIVTVMAQGGAIATNKYLPLSLRLPNALYAYVMYLAKAFWPSHLAAFYPYEGSRLAGWQTLLCALLLVAITAWVWRSRSHYYLLMGWLWFLGTLVPVSGIVMQVGDQSMADRYAYLPLIGIFCMVVWSAADWAQGRNFKLRECAAFAGVALAILSFLTWRQIGFWGSSYDLWSHALQVTKDNYMAEDYVGTALLVQAYEASGQRFSDEALVHFQNAVRIEPRDAISHLNVGASLHEHGKLQEAIKEYQAVLGLTPDQHLIVKSLIDLGAAYGQLGDFPTAGQYYRKALAIEPGNPVVFSYLGKLAMNERVHELAASAAAHPSPAAYLQLGMLQQSVGLLPEARASYQTALKLKPEFPEAKSALKSLGNEVTR
jgi:tetratricopeptide (TPR) repeat protein